MSDYGAVREPRGECWVQSPKLEGNELEESRVQTEAIESGLPLGDEKVLVTVPGKLLASTHRGNLVTRFAALHWSGSGTKEPSQVRPSMSVDEGAADSNAIAATVFA